MEETGYTAKECKLLGKLDPLPAYVNSPGYVVLAHIGEIQEEVVDKEELQELSKVDINEAINLIKSGEINEMQAVSAILLANEHLKVSGKFDT